MRRRANRRPHALYVVWRRYQGRVDSMQDWFGYTPRYLGRSFSSRWARPVEYVGKAMWTAMTFVRSRPSEIWVQIPPTPLLYVAAIYRALFRDVVLVADCHNTLLQAPWIRTPGLRYALNRGVDIVLVHNSHVHRHALEFGVDPARCLVLETRPATPSASTAPPLPVTDGAPGPCVLFPAGFDPDEPIEAFAEAARQLPDVNFLVTGDSRRAGPHFDEAALPPNVVALGWVDADHYKRLLRAADLVLGLTLLEGVQLSVANEAVGYGKALVLSDTRLLRSLFPRGAVYVGNDAAGIAAGIRTALRRRAALEADAARLRLERLERWTAQARVVRRRLERDT